MMTVFPLLLALGLQKFRDEFPVSIHANSEKVGSGAKFCQCPGLSFFFASGPFKSRSPPQFGQFVRQSSFVRSVVLPTLQTSGKNNGLLATEAANELKTLRPSGFSDFQQKRSQRNIISGVVMKREKRKKHICRPVFASFRNETFN